MDNTKTIIIEREFNAPIDLVWKVYTQKEHIEKWFGPKGFNTKVALNEFRKNGNYEYIMIGPDRKEYPSVGTYKEIKEQEFIIATDDFGDDFRKDNDKLPEGMITEVHFEDLGEKTKLKIIINHPSVEEKLKHEKMGVIEGFTSMFDCLDEYLYELK